nr:hypothetical protein [uncultured bacterium]
MAESLAERGVAALDGVGRGVVRPLALSALVALSMWALFSAEDAFTAVTGLPVLDTQNDLTAASAAEQIARYDDAARGAYALFAAIDYVFPAVASLLLAVIAHRLIAVGPRRASGAPLVPPAAALLGLVPAVADYAENVALTGAVLTGGAPGWIAAGLAAKAAKLASLTGAQAALGLLTLLAVVGAAARLRRRSAPVRG